MIVKPIGEIGRPSVFIHLAGDSCSVQCTDLARKCQASIRELGVVEWLNTKAVACSEQALLPGIPNRECKHPNEMVQASLAPALVRCEDYFRVRVGPIWVISQLSSKFQEVVNFSIEHEM